MENTALEKLIFTIYNNSTMVIKNLILVVFLAFTASHCLAQLPQSLTKSDSTLLENFNYTVNVPRPNEAKGVAVLIPGLYDHPFSIFFESSLPQLLNDLNYAVIIPVLSQKGDRFDLSSKSVLQLSRLIKQYIQTSNLRQDIPVILGGFSIGGTRVLKACTSKDSPMKELNISHVFAIDPPLDLNRLLASEAKYDETFIKEVLVEEIGHLDSEKLSSLSLVNINNIASIAPPIIKGVKIRIYSEPALEWQMENRKRDLLDLNLLDQSVYVNFLKRTYSDVNIELVLSKIEGMRIQTDERNPHSWNIVDTDEFIEWINNNE
ncbi:hypothetical protein ORI89_04055 [Sphingobacterium sp. UT-1RO-CII-1]|uniref:hypothetical protein n=1 Tax=Sphingobacterium sp. UT-1RO-CII-1 TaxID=2995225 RepID=UPI00227A2BA4|nr:hypothetical protein [Sphingobacterium sp. UT-1RO-CII-1]MCY4778813.1 hypothetical protein [Sphingobacterium sp. UT-1RO-CII-1]